MGKITFGVFCAIDCWSLEGWLGRAARSFYGSACWSGNSVCSYLFFVICFQNVWWLNLLRLYRLDKSVALKHTSYFHWPISEWRKNIPLLSSLVWNLLHITLSFSKVQQIRLFSSIRGALSFILLRSGRSLRCWPISRRLLYRSFVFSVAKMTEITYPVKTLGVIRLHIYSLALFGRVNSLLNFLVCQLLLNWRRKSSLLNACQIILFVVKFHLEERIANVHARRSFSWKRNFLRNLLR